MRFLCCEANVHYLSWASISSGKWDSGRTKTIIQYLQVFFSPSVIIDQGEDQAASVAKSEPT